MITKTIYHVFTDNWDDFTEDKQEAYRIYDSLCQDNENVRLYSEKEDDQDGNFYDEQLIESKGQFPS